MLFLFGFSITLDILDKSVYSTHDLDCESLVYWFTGYRKDARTEHLECS